MIFSFSLYRSDHHLCDFDFQHEIFLKYKTLPGGASELHKTVRIPCWLAGLPSSAYQLPSFKYENYFWLLGINLGDHTTPLLIPR